MSMLLHPEYYQVIKQKYQSEYDIVTIQSVNDMQAIKLTRFTQISKRDMIV